MRGRPAANQRLHDSEQLISKLDFRLEGSTFLWYPWTLAACAKVFADEQAGPAAGSARRCVVDLGLKADEVRQHIEKEYMYVWSENVLAAALAAGGRL